MSDYDVPVLIVGGGGCGLSLAIFLRDLDVRSLLVERNPTTTDLPRAHILNRRTMDDDGVNARIADRTSGAHYTVRSRYLIAADGGKTIGRMLDVPFDGPRKLRRMVNAFFSADLSRWVDDDTVLLFYFISPDALGAWGGGGLLKAGPTRWDRHAESWVFMREVQPDDPEVIDEANAAQRIREILRIPDLPLQIHKIGRWDVEGVAARQYRFGRVFLAGDAAHRHPPVSALGLNTAFGDSRHPTARLRRSAIRWRVSTNPTRGLARVCRMHGWSATASVCRRTTWSRWGGSRCSWARTLRPGSPRGRAWRCSAECRSMSW